MIHIIVAVDKSGGIGKDNGLLCYLPADLKHFKTLTMGHPIIMGRKTFESLPRLLPAGTISSLPIRHTMERTIRALPYILLFQLLSMPSKGTRTISSSAARLFMTHSFPMRRVCM